MWWCDLGPVTSLFPEEYMFLLPACQCPSPRKHLGQMMDSHFFVPAAGPTPTCQRVSQYGIQGEPGTAGGREHPAFPRGPGWGHWHLQPSGHRDNHHPCPCDPKPSCLPSPFLVLPLAAGILMWSSGQKRAGNCVSLKCF